MPNKRSCSDVVSVSIAETGIPYLCTVDYFFERQLQLNTIDGLNPLPMPDQTSNWKIRVKKGNYEVEVEGPTPERVEKMFDELVKKYMKKIARP